MNRVKLSALADYVLEKKKSNGHASELYIGVDNMLPDHAGVRPSDYPPEEGVNVTIFKPGDILIGNIRPYFKKIWLADCPGCCSADVLVLRPKAEVDSGFLFAALSDDAFFGYVMKGAKGTQMPRGDKAHIMDYPVAQPNNQHAVSELVSLLDTATADSKSICSDLDAAAKLLYDYWFVQFDFPDENGRPYKSSGGKMVWNDELKREIPERWTVAHASDLFDLERGYSYSSGDLSERSGVPFISLACFGRKLDYRSEELKHLKDGVECASWVKPNDMLIACTDLTRGADIIGCPIRVPDQFDRYVYSMDLAKVINLSQDVKQSYLYQSLRTDWFHKFAKGHTSGTNVIHLNLDVFKWFALAVPPIELQESYEKICRNLFALSDLKLCESVELETTRDFLLPLLMNGQVTIGDDGE